MNEQPLPDFDFPPQPSAQPAPKKPRSTSRRKRPTKKAAKRAAPASKPAKRVAKKRRVRKTPIQYGTVEQKAAAGRAYAAEQKHPPLMTEEFNATLDIIVTMHAFEPLIRRRIMDRLIKTFP